MDCCVCAGGPTLTFVWKAAWRQNVDRAGKAAVRRGMKHDLYRQWSGVDWGNMTCAVSGVVLTGETCRQWSGVDWGILTCAVSGVALTGET